MFPFNFTSSCSGISIGVGIVFFFFNSSVFLQVLESAASLLCLDTFQFGDALTQKFMVLRGEEITTPLTVEQVRREGRGKGEGGRKEEGREQKREGREQKRMEGSRRGKEGSRRGKEERGWREEMKGEIVCVLS